MAVLALFLLLPALWAGCGDGEDGGDTTAAPTKAEFLTEGQALCEQEANRTEREVEEFGEQNNLEYRKDPPAEVFEEAAEEIYVPSVERQLEELQALGVPPGEEQALEEIYAAAEEGLEEGKADPSLLISGQALAKVRGLVADYGLDSCFQ